MTKNSAEKSLEKDSSETLKDHVEQAEKALMGVKLELEDCWMHESIKEECWDKVRNLSREISQKIIDEDFEADREEITELIKQVKVVADEVNEKLIDKRLWSSQKAISEYRKYLSGIDSSSTNLSLNEITKEHLDQLREKSSEHLNAIHNHGDMLLKDNKEAQALMDEVDELWKTIVNNQLKVIEKIIPFIQEQLDDLDKNFPTLNNKQQSHFTAFKVFLKEQIDFLQDCLTMRTDGFDKIVMRINPTS